MQLERAVRAILARTFAIRHGRDVPFEELRREVAREGVSAEDLASTLTDLKAQRLAVETVHGWRPCAPPPASRAKGAMAAFSWIHS